MKLLYMSFVLPLVRSAGEELNFELCIYKLHYIADFTFHMMWRKTKDVLHGVKNNSVGNIKVKNQVLFKGRDSSQVKMVHGTG